MIQGKLYVFSAPSGAGKSSLINALLKENLSCNTQISISYTTRNIRPNEIHGKHYFFISIKEFKKMISENAFIEYAKVFGNYYGTSYKNITKSINLGIDVFLDIDWQGAQQIRKKIHSSCNIFILPPSKLELNSRLHNRAQDSKKSIFKRMNKAIIEMKHYIEYDYLIINDNFNNAIYDLKSIIIAENLRTSRQKVRHNFLINNLLKFNKN